MIARHPIPDTLYWLALARFAQIGMTPKPCEVCPAPVAWVVITAYAASQERPQPLRDPVHVHHDDEDERPAGEGTREFRTHLCGEHATVFLEAIADRVGARDA